jgi:Tfp pilus assembly protein PilV
MRGTWFRRIEQEVRLTIMVKSRRQAGFSLTETLLAVATLAIGLVFIAGTFLTGVFFSTTSTERTVAAVVAEEALAKMRIYGLDPNGSGLRTDGFVLYAPSQNMPAEEHLYPSTRLEPQRQYSWAALCRRMSPGSSLVQCVVFVSRQTADATYWVRQSGASGPQLGTASLPQPVRVNLIQGAVPANPEVMTLQDAVPSDGIDELAFVNDGSILVDDSTGQVYRVLERYGTPPDKIRLDRAWSGGSAWVVPPATSGGRNPVVAVYQDVIRFPGN